MKHLSALLLTVSFATPLAQAAKITLPEPLTPACRPAQPGPTPPAPTPKPPIPPPPKPAPPAQLDADGPEPESLGLPLLDQALNGEAPRSLLPLWHAYPWRKVVFPKTWTFYALETLREDGRDLLKTVPADAAWFCPRYASLTEEQRLIFWARFLSLIAESESTFNPLQVTWDHGVGLHVFSTGLMMLSIESVKNDSYRCTMINSQDDLFFWRKNLRCAVRIMNHWVGQDRSISLNPHEPRRGWQGVARYWQPARDARMRSGLGRQCLNEMIEQRRPDWKNVSFPTRHPAIFDSDYRAAGEKRFERFLRLLNELPFCS